MEKLPKDLFRNGFAISGGIDDKPINISSLEAVRNFIRDNFKKSKTINAKIGSYKLKHILERNMGDNQIEISNGDLIASMILEGYDYKKDGKITRNANFNLSQLSLRKFLER